MKNLKKVLALVLALACSLSLFAGATFKDSSDINANEAVDTLVALGVIDGYQDGTFRPNNTVTRAEMAKMIYAVRTGNDDASAFANAPTTFTDVNYHWASGYIKYAQSLGIVSGKSATRFEPDSVVTGAEAAKMLLVTIGYDANQAGFTGANWASNVMARAAETDILDKVEGQLSSGLARQYAAQMIFNAIDTDVVAYENGAYTKKQTTKTVSVPKETGQVQTSYKVVQNGVELSDVYYSLSDAEAAITDMKETEEGAASTYTTNKYTNKIVTWVSETQSTYETVGQKYLKLADTEGVLTYVSEDNKGTYTIRIGNEQFTKVSKNMSDMLYQSVRVLHKSSSDVYGVIATDDNEVVVSGIVDDFKTVKASDTKVTFNGTSYKLDDKASEIPVYVLGENSEKSGQNLFSVANAASDRAFSIKLISNNGDENIDAAVMVPFTVNKVTYVGSESMTLANKGNIDLDDANVAEDVRKDDYAIVIDKANTVDGKHEVTKADVVTGEATGVRGDNEVLVNGTWYENINSEVGSYTLKNKYDLVVVGNFVFNVSRNSGTTADDILYVDDAGDIANGLNRDKVEAKVFFNDGTSQPIVVKTVDGKSSAGMAASIRNKMFTYETKNGEYELTPVSAENLADHDSVMDITKYENKRFDTTVIYDDATIFVNSEDSKQDTRVLSGKQVKNWKKITEGMSGQGLVKREGGIDYVFVASITVPKIPTSTGSTAYGYLTDTPYRTQDEDKNTIYMFEIWNGESTLKVQADSETRYANLKKGDAIRFESVSDSEVSEVDKLTDLTNADIAALVGVDGNNVNVRNEDTTKTLVSDATTITKDTQLIFINSDDKTGANGGISQAEIMANGDAYANAYVVADPDEAGEILAIIFDVNNKLRTLNGETITIAAPAYEAVVAVDTVEGVAVINSALLKLADTEGAGEESVTAKLNDKVVLTLTHDEAVKVKVTFKPDNGTASVSKTVTLEADTALEVPYTMVGANVTVTVSLAD